MEKQLFLFQMLDLNATFANQDPSPTLRPGNFDLHTKIPGSPCLNRSTQMPNLYLFSSRRQAE